MKSLLIYLVAAISILPIPLKAQLSWYSCPKDNDKTVDLKLYPTDNSPSIVVIPKDKKIKLVSIVLTDDVNIWGEVKYNKVYGYMKGTNICF